MFNPKSKTHVTSHMPLARVWSHGHFLQGELSGHVRAKTILAEGQKGIGG